MDSIGYQDHVPITTNEVVDQFLLPGGGSTVPFLHLTKLWVPVLRAFCVIRGIGNAQAFFGANKQTKHLLCLISGMQNSMVGE